MGPHPGARNTSTTRVGGEPAPAADEESSVTALDQATEMVDPVPGAAAPHLPQQPDLIQLLTPEGERVEHPDYSLDISDDEDAGLPGTKDLRKFSYSKAEDVVQNHMKHRSAGLSTRMKRKKKVHDRQLSTDSEKDVENEGDQQRSGNSAGILSTLLNLYQQPDPDFSDGALSYASSRRSSFEHLEETIAEQERSKLISKSERQKAAKKADRGTALDYFPSYFSHITLC